MAWTRIQLLDWVRARIDEVSDITETQTVSSNLIAQEVDEAALQVYHLARRPLIYPAGRVHTENAYVTTRSLIIPIQNEFVRFLRVKAYGWEVYAEELIQSDTNTYNHQRSIYGRADERQPKAALIPFRFTKTVGSVTTQFTQAIELFPRPESLTPFERDDSVSGSNANGSAYGLDAYKNTGVTAGKVAIVPELLVVMRDRLPAANDATVPFPDSLIDAIVWQVAGRALIILRDAGAATAAFQNAVAVMNGLRYGFRGEEGTVKLGKANG